MTVNPIPTGPATRAGLVGAAAAFAGAVVAATQGLTTEAVTAVVASGLTLLAVLGGRYAQAAAAIRSAAGPVRDVAASVATHELPAGRNPDPVDAALDDGKLLADDADELGLDASLLEATPAERIPADHDDNRVAL